MDIKPLVVILAICTVAVLFVVANLPSTFAIDENWWIIYMDNEYEGTSAPWLATEFGCNLYPIDEEADPVTAIDTAGLNQEGMSLLFLGGNDPLAYAAPWWDPIRPSLTIMRPPTFPDVYIMSDGTWANVWVHTPKGSFTMRDNGTLVHDYGVIARGYDENLDRWVMFAVGFSAECTACGADLIIEDYETVKSYSWIVYENLSGQDIPVADWTDYNWQYSIVEKG